MTAHDLPFRKERPTEPGVYAFRRVPLYPETDTDPRDNSPGLMSVREDGSVIFHGWCPETAGYKSLEESQWDETRTEVCLLAPSKDNDDRPSDSVDLFVEAVKRLEAALRGCVSQTNDPVAESYARDAIDWLRKCGLSSNGPSR